MIDAATTGTWLGQQVTFLTVDDGPFETFMVSNTISGPNVYVQLGSDSVREIGADQPADTAYPANGFKRLIVQGTGYTGAAAGEWYTVIGNCATEDIARCGSWSAPASHIGGATTFVLNPLAEVRDEQIGWWLQPNINCQAWFPIIAVSESAHTVTVAGNHVALGAQGTRFRIHAPPGVATRGAQAGTLPKFAEAASSRCLYKGYRYETAAAGRWTSQGIAARQGGSNFTGQHYTLFRHFDPSLMRFTSLDPIAASQNLWAYCDNNPHGAYDPDGLDTEKKWTAQSWFGDIWREGWGWVDRSVGGNGWIAGMGQIGGGTADMVYLAVTLPAQPIIWAASGEAPMPVQNWVNTVNNVGARWDYLSRADEGTGTKLAAVSIGVATDLSGLTGLGEAYSGHSLTTGDALTQEERNMRWVTGGFTLAMYVAPVAGKGLGWARGRLGLGKASASPRQQIMSEFRRFKSQGFTNKQAYHLAQPYEGMGHHFVPRRVGLPSLYSESRFNVLKPNGINRGSFYELHYRVDPKFHGTAFPESVGGTWKGAKLGLQKEGFLGRMWFGSPRPLKWAVGGASAAGAGIASWMESED